MVHLTVIIVNYNVHYFLEQALQSVIRASQNLTVETIVVDNASSDQSVQMVADKFPLVHCIANPKNVGFSTANNQGIKMAKGKYILLLNPDTVVQEDTFDKCFAAMEKDPKIGGLGVKMIDGKGNFLPESKRGLPTPSVAFYKVFGLSSLFPKSKVFGKYHLGYLNENENHEIEVLAGAFLMMPTQLAQSLGGLDETFFMYGEDIDLSYRITLAGYKNYYLAETEIIHYKGESTKKGSLNYVRVFYEAMLIFAKKHFTTKQAKVYSVAIYLAIFLKGMFTIISNVAKRIALPLFDIALGYTGLFLISQLWAEKIKTSITSYPKEFIFGVLPVYLLLWVVSSYFNAAYDKPYKIKSIFKGVVWGTLLIAAVYAFLPENLRFSRAIILLGGVWTGVAMLVSRLIYHVLTEKALRFELSANNNVAIIGNHEEGNRALNILTQTSDKANFIGFINYDSDAKDENSLGDFTHLETIINLYNINELIFCAENVPTSSVIQKMTSLGNSFSYKILPRSSSSIIGSNSKNTSGDLYAIDVHLNLNARRARQSKRLFDILTSLLLLVTIALNVWFVKEKVSYFSNLFKVLLGRKTWIGYLPSDDIKEYQLPKLKPSVIFPSSTFYIKEKGLTGNRLNLLYAKDYTLELDLQYLLKNFQFLGTN